MKQEAGKEVRQVVCQYAGQTVRQEVRKEAKQEVTQELRQIRWSAIKPGSKSNRRKDR
jgi:hypothetical protein